MPQIMKTAAQIEQAVNDVATKANIVLDNLDTFTNATKPTAASTSGEFFLVDDLLTYSNGVDLFQYARLNADGDLVAEIIPRTDTLAQLEMVSTGSTGELASATNQAAIVQMISGDAPGHVFRPGQSFRHVDVTTPTITIESNYDVITIGIASETDPAISLVAGLSIGQELLCIVTSTDATVASITIEGLTIPGGANIDTTPEFLSILFRWNGSQWGVVDTINRDDNVISGIGSISNGTSNTISGNGSYSEGSDNIISGDFSHAEGKFNVITLNSGHAEGLSNKVFSSYGHAEGNANKVGAAGAHAEGLQTSSIGSYAHTQGTSTVGAATNSDATGNNTVAAGENSSAAGDGSKAGLSSAAMVSGVTVSSVGSDFTLYFDVGDTVTVSPVSVNGAPISTTLTAVTAGSMTLADATMLDGFSYLYNTSASKNTSAAGRGALAIQRAESSHAGKAGFDHSLVNMQIATADATASVYMTTDGESAEASYSLGRTNRYILDNSMSYAGRITINAKEELSSNVAMFVRDVLISTDGTLSIKKNEAIGTDYIEGGFLISAPTIQVNDTNKELEILVTGIAATNIKWHAVCDFSRI